MVGSQPGNRQQQRRADALLCETAAALTRPLNLPAQCVAVASNLFLLVQVHGLGQDPRVRGLQEQFRAIADTGPCQDLLSHQLRYGSRLASAPGQLLYEELHKLFSLADDVHALRALGFSADQSLVERFAADLRARFAAQPWPARLVAQDRAQDWNRSLWWYAENLDQGRAGRPTMP
jgi:hypothetical protein